MITGFKEQTYELTDYELNTLVPLLISGLSSKIGKANAISNRNMVKALRDSGHKVSEPRIRKMINYIRCEGLVDRLLANSSGYYVSNSGIEIKEYLKSLEQRESAIAQVRQALERQFTKRAVLKGQTELGF